MPRVVPSEVVGLVDRLFPWARDQAILPAALHQMDYGSLGTVAALVDMVERIPDELVTWTCPGLVDTAVKGL